jgi:beta-N-acetylglucosaminidase
VQENNPGVPPKIDKEMARMRNEVKMIADSIIQAHDGQAYYNFGEVSKIIGCGINTVSHMLHNSGIIVKRVGPSKRISAYDIADLMCTGRVAVID